MRILSELITRNVDNERFVQIYDIPFIYESDLLKKWGFENRVTIPVGFVQDFESIPIVRGRNKRGGTVHDYMSCFDSIPIVTQWQAADLYAEMNAYTDSIDHGRGWITKVYDCMRRGSKAAVVRFWPGFFHRRSVLATVKEIAGVDGDPYVTIEEKIEEIIEKTEQVVEEIKDIKAEQAPTTIAETVKIDQIVETIVKIEQVAEDLKDVKQGVVEVIEQKAVEKNISDIV